HPRDRTWRWNAGPASGHTVHATEAHHRPRPAAALPCGRRSERADPAGVARIPAAAHRRSGRHAMDPRDVARRDRGGCRTSRVLTRSHLRSGSDDSLAYDRLEEVALGLAAGAAREPEQPVTRV